MDNQRWVIPNKNREVLVALPGNLDRKDQVIWVTEKLANCFSQKWEQAFYNPN